MPSEYKIQLTVRINPALHGPDLEKWLNSDKKKLEQCLNADRRKLEQCLGLLIDKGSGRDILQKDTSRREEVGWCVVDKVEVI